MIEQESLNKLAEALKSTCDSSMDIVDGAHQASRLERKSKKASIKSEKHLEEINGRVADIDNGLNVEREERKAADDENAIRTARQDKKFFWLGVLCSAIIALAVEYLPEILGFLQAMFQQHSP